VEEILLEAEEADAMGKNHQSRADLFAKLEDPATSDQFFDQVAEDVNWTVMGTHQLAGTYRDKKSFHAATFDRLTPLMRDGVRLRLQNLYLDDDTAIAELQATSTTNEGSPFDNTYCWVCRFDGDRIVEVRAYLDSAMIAYTVARNEQPG
jgi:ketosteroid isomerase-like protein